jgi:amino acid adenylation domain-containing protein
MGIPVATDVLDVVETYQLGPAQRLWAGMPGAVHRLTLRFDTAPDRERLIAALRQTGESFEALRTRFVARPGLMLPVQLIEAEQPRWLEDAKLDAAEGPVAGAELDGADLILSALAIALDRQGMLLWARAVANAYRGAQPGDTVQPADAAEGLMALADDPAAAAAHGFWRSAIAEGEPAGRLPEERAEGAYQLARIAQHWDRAPSAGQALALWRAWLCREAGSERITIGVELSGRDADLADSVGCYARLVPCTIGGGTGAAEAWIGKADNWMLAAPDPAGPAAEAIGGITIYPYGFVDRTEETDMAIQWHEQAVLPCRLRLALVPGGFELEYDAGRLSSDTLADRFAHFVAQALADPERELADIPRLPSEAAAAVAARSMGPASAPDPDRTVVDAIGEIAAAHPDRIALTDPAGSISYAEFWDRSGHIASWLAERGVERGARVALVASRSAETVTALIGILRAGAIAVPIDPAYPAARQAMLIADVAADLVLTDSPDAGPFDAATLSIAEALQSDGHLPPPPGANDGVYIIHTSGSTGKPKGVLVTHANLWASTRARFTAYPTAPACFLLTPSLSFDSSVAGLYWTLATGGRLLLPAPGEERDPGELARWIAEGAPSHWLTVPALYQNVLTAARDGELASLSDVIVAGEACPATLVAQHAARMADARLHNEYGPTEATVWSSLWSWQPGDALPEAVPIGRPIPGAAIYLADARGGLVPDGAAGEIRIGGAGVASGYLGRPDATAAAFHPNPFGEGRLYATGDLGRRDEDGNILYLGRIDRQLKIGGRRIEPGEIEARLDALPGVSRSVVLVRGGRLIGYVEAANGFDAAAAKAALAAGLPPWLVPEAIVALARFPASANGKLDTDALPDPEQASRPAYRAPASAAEQALAAAIEDVVGVERPGLDDDFFALGGDSLMALQVAARLRGSGFALSVRSIFATPGIEKLAALAVPVAVQAETSDEGPAPLTPIQRWFVARDLPEPNHYNQAVAFEVRESLSPDRLAAALAQVAARHPALRSAVERDGDGWRVRPLPGAPEAPGWFDLRALPAPVRDRVLGQKLGELQRGLDPSQGRMWRAAGFRLAADRPDLLVIAAHHLAIDARSWQILAEDLAAAYRDAPLAPALSYGQWSAALAGQEPDTAWSAYLAGAEARLPRDHDGANREADATELALTLPAAQAKALAHWRGARPGRGLSDAMLATLAIVLGDWTGHRRLLIDVEGSGRDVPAELPDPSRTIGWLTTLAPLALPHDPGAPLEVRLRDTVAAIDAAPADWRYALDAPIGPHSSAEFCVNFMGAMAGDGEAGGLLRPVSLDLGAMRGPANPRAHLIELEAETRTDGLHLLWRYPAAIHDAATIRALAERHRTLMTELAGAA